MLVVAVPGMVELLGGPNDCRVFQAGCSEVKMIRGPNLGHGCPRPAEVEGTDNQTDIGSVSREERTENSFPGIFLIPAYLPALSASQAGFKVQGSAQGCFLGCVNSLPACSLANSHAFLPISVLSGYHCTLRHNIHKKAKTLMWG